MHHINMYTANIQRTKIQEVSSKELKILTEDLRSKVMKKEKEEGQQNFYVLFIHGFVLIVSTFIQKIIYQNIDAIIKGMNNQVILI